MMKLCKNGDIKDTSSRSKCTLASTTCVTLVIFVGAWGILMSNLWSHIINLVPPQMQGMRKNTLKIKVLKHNEILSDKAVINKLLEVNKNVGRNFKK
jgi:hypothetical protein